jgi:acyl-coenzyme A synthetase/AMP-(fatty) acid ligase
MRRVGTDRVLGIATQAPQRSLDNERDVYFIYTSGTTGFPKGVRVQEGAFRHAVVNAAEVLGLDDTTRALCVSSFHFDGSYGNLFPTLVAGGALVIPRREELLYLKRFYSSLQDDGINHTSFSPSYLRLLLSGRGLPALAGSQLRTMALGGEECVAEDVARLWELLPGLRVFNRYGPTETTIAVTTYEVTPADVASGRVPIGRPHPGVSFWLVGDDGALIDKPNRTGELYIGGKQLMRGYWGDDNLSESVLRRDVVPGEIVYKTGDLVYRDTRGLYVYVGRSDDVVKRNGVRISLSEVALALRRVEGVAGAVCLAIASSDRLAIAAFVATAVTEAEVRDGAKDFLPPSMVPDELVLVSSLPMTPSGKVDRQRLLADAALAGWRDGTALGY